ncbi:MAG: pyruvate synthase subunit PorA [Thermoplasmata archaeon]|nr:pyruvate synthase subunit PorA [Thermoplasmata archaeon]
MAMKMVLRGNMATAYAAKLARVEVIPAYPITPSTLFPEKISEFVANGELKCQFIKCESEHSAMSACIGASATGARVATATSSQGLALMHEVVFIAAGLRLPIVMAIGNRALSAPINIWCDHQDTIAERDSGWLQFYAEKNQETLDLMLMAFKICEDHRVLLPGMVGMDAFVLTHTMECVDIPEQEEVDRFLPPYKPVYKLDVNNPMTFGAFSSPDNYMEFRYAVHMAMESAVKVIDEVFEEFEKKFGRNYQRVVPFMVEDAEVILVTIGSMTGTAREAVRLLRSKGKKVGLLKITTLRPFPKDLLKKYLKDAKVVVVLERNISLGFGGAVYPEIAAVFANAARRPKIYDFIIGLGGRDIVVEDIVKVYEIAMDALKAKKAEMVEWIGVRKDEIEVIK